jgi:hydrophobe/amphiphile efflux-3 (HAE3) family protein
VSARLERIVRAASARPGRMLLAAVLVAVAGALLSLRLEPTASTDTLVGRGSAAAKSTDTLHRRFGDDAVVILVRGSLPDIVLTDNLSRLLGLEGCIAGNKPAGAPAPGGPRSPCARFARTKPVRVVYGPGTFINSAVDEIQRQLTTQVEAATERSKQAAQAARRVAAARGDTRAEQDRYAKQASDLVQAQFQRDLLTLAVRYGLSATSANPQVNNPDFVYRLVFDAARGAGTPKARFAYLFPNDRSALIQVRLEPGLGDAERARAIRLIRQAVAMPEWAPTNGVTYTVTGAPVVVNDVTAELSSSLLRLLVGGLVMMALVLALVFRARARLLPLGVALAAAATLGGLMWLLGLELTMASIAVLPVLLGLGVDYAIQYQARVQEHGVERAARIALPTIATAGLATAAGFLVLLLSPVPMVRGFGVLLVAGIALAFVFALTAGTAALVILARRGPSEHVLAASARGAGDLLAWAARPLGPPARAARRAAGGAATRVTGFALRRPVAVLAVGAVLAVAGLAVDSSTPVVSDIRRLVPADLPAVRDLVSLQDTTGVAGDVDVVVEGRDLTQAAVVRWMRDYQQRLVERFDYSTRNGCGEAQLCPALSLPDLFRSASASASRARVRALLDAVPPYFSQAVITRDRRTAVLSFGIKLMSLERQQRVIDVMRADLDPPPGVTARVAGLTVLGAEANAALTSPVRRLGTLAAGLLAVALVLFAVYRRWERAWVPLVPIALAAGWSALVLWAVGIPLNPMSATLSALVIAISTEFAVLLVARFREERARGHAVAAALRRTYASTGAAVLASGVTAIAGFAVLAFSDVRMLKDFGLVTVVDLTVSLLGVLAVLPAVLVLAERRRGRRAGAAQAEPAPEAPALV